MHLEQEGANNKLIYIWGLPWRSNFCNRKTGTVICPWKGWNASSGLKDYCSALSVEAAGAPLSFTSPSPGGDLIPEISASLSSPSPASLSPRCWRLATCTKRVPLRQGSTLLRSDEQMLSPCQPRTWGDAAQLACTDEGWKGFLKCHSVWRTLLQSYIGSKGSSSPFAEPSPATEKLSV